jgi:hypothetical protein
MDDLIWSLVQGSQKPTILCHWEWVVTNGIRIIVQPEMGGVCISPWGLPAGTHWDTKNEMILWRSPSGTLGLKRMWLWRPTSLEYGNENVLICIFAPFLTQPVLKPWYPWTYQNSTIKNAIARVVPGWVTSWEVWFKRAKSEQYCASEVGSLHQIKIFVLRMLFYFDKFMGNSTSQLPANWFGGIASNSPS